MVLINYGHTIRYPLIILIFILISSIILTPVSADKCQDCHGTDGGYTFQPLILHASTPRVVSPNEEFEHVIIIQHPGEYEAYSISMELNLALATQLSAMSSKIIDLPAMSGGAEEVVFKLKAKDPSQSQRIRTIVRYTSSFHYDPTEITEVLDISINIDRILLEPSTWSIKISETDKKTINLKALEDVKNILILPSSSLKEIIKIESRSIQTLSKGNSIDINFQARSIGEGKLNIIYEDSSGVPHKIILDVQVTKDFKKEGMIWVQIGIITGVLSWVILFISLVVGAPFKKLKVKLKSVFKKNIIRKEFHCGISYIISILALFHAVVVMANHWYGVVVYNSFLFADPAMDYGIYINLGTAAWLLMVVVSFTGIFWKRIIKLVKYNAWRWSHNIITLLALIISSIHVAIMLDFRFL